MDQENARFGGFTTMMGLLVEAFKCKNIGGCFDEVLVVANFFSKLDLPTDGISAMHWPHVASQLAFLFFCRVIRCVVFRPFLDPG